MTRTHLPHRVHLPPGGLRLIGLCLVAMILAFGVTEAALRGGFYERPRWYPTAVEKLDGRPAKFLFIGSSRVSAAIDVRRFATLTGTPEDLTLNVGQGFSTVTAHALGIRRLSELGLLKGTTVFMEAPLGVVETGTWQTRWYQIEGAHFLMSVLEGRDLPALWRSDQSVEEKLAASGRWLLKPAWISIYREDIRVKGLGRTYALAGLSSAPPDDQRGVRRDVDDISRIRAAAIANGQEAARTPVVNDWSATVTAWIVKRVQESGGQVVFYEMPMSAPMAVVSPSIAQNARTLSAQAAQWNVPMLKADVVFAADDFPDLWHLSVPASWRFTDALAAAWLSRAQTR
jgi:hypothetical protein